MENEFWSEVVTEVCGKPTKISITEFADRTFIVATQIEKIAVIVRADPRIPQGKPLSDVIYDTRVTFGTENSEHHLIARVLAEKLKITKPLELALALTDFTLPAVRSLTEAIFTARETNIPIPLSSV